VSDVINDHPLDVIAHDSDVDAAADIAPSDTALDDTPTGMDAAADSGTDSMADGSHCTDASTAGVRVPASIDATGASDTSAALNSFIAGVTDGSTIVFPSCGTYRLDQGIQLANRHNLVFEGNGTTLRVGPTADGHSQLSSPFVLGHQYGGSWSAGDSYITIRNFNLVGNSPTPGVFVNGTEGEHAVEVENSTHIEIANITVSGVWGDGIKVGGTSDTVWFHGSHVVSAGRNGVTVTMGQNVTAENNAFDTIGYCTLDIESNSGTEHSSNIVFRNNTAGSWGNIFVAADGIAGSGVNSVTVTGNVVTRGSLQTDITLARRQNIVFSDNTSLVQATGPVLVFAHVDGVTVNRNVQPLRSGTLASFTDCTGVTFSP
jgi:hypothetical protein